MTASTRFSQEEQCAPGRPYPEERKKHQTVITTFIN